MPEPRSLQRRATLTLSALMVVLGIAILVVTFANGGGPLTLGFVFGLLFVAAGAGRFYITRRHL